MDLSFKISFLSDHSACDGREGRLKDIFEMYGFKVLKIYGAGYYPFTGILSRFLSRIDPIHSAFITIVARKKQ